MTTTRQSSIYRTFNGDCDINNHAANTL